METCGVERIGDDSFEAVVNGLRNDTDVDSENVEPRTCVHELHLGGVDLALLYPLASLSLQQPENQLELILQVARVHDLRVLPSTTPAEAAEPGLDGGSSVLFVHAADGLSDLDRVESGPLGNPPPEDRVFDNVDRPATFPGRYSHAVVHLIQTRVPAPHPHLKVVDRLEGELALADALAVCGEQSTDAAEPGGIGDVEPTYISAHAQDLSVLRTQAATAGSVVVVLQRHASQIQCGAHVAENPIAHHSSSALHVL